MVMPLFALSLFGQAQPQGEYFYDPIFPESLLQYFVEDTSRRGWQEIGDKWVISALCVAVLCTFLMAFVQIFMNARRHDIDNPRGILGSFGLVGSGFFLVIGSCLGAWQFFVPNPEMIKPYGLLIGTILSMGMYFFLMFPLSFIVIKYWHPSSNNRK